MIKIHRPDLADMPSWYPYFIDLVNGDDLLEALEENKKELVTLISSIPSEAEEFSYAENKWTIRQVFIHLADDERYYAYKAFSYSRRSDVFLEVPRGQVYNENFNTAGRTLQDICEEIVSIRNATITLFSHMNDEMLDFKFPDQKDNYTARSLGWMTVGHAIHHCNFLREKYLI